MNWVFDNIQLIIVVASTIAWWLTQRKQAEAPPEDPMERPGRQPIEFEQDDSDAARQVRERMRRLREQRGLTREDEQVPPLPQRPQPSVENIPPVLRELMGIPEPKPQPVVPPPVPRIDHGARMAAQMRELENQRRESEATAAKVRAQTVSRQKQWSRPAAARRTGSLDDRDFLATLRDPRSARRAIILREVLGKPIALR